MKDYEAIRHLVTDSTGRRLTVGLFEELADPTASIKPPFTLADWRAEYVRISDPTDYAAAMELLGCWEHWQMLCNSQVFMEQLEKWRGEVEAKLASEGVAELRKQSKTAKGTQAAKWLAEKGFLEKGTGKRGRPKKREDVAPDESHLVRKHAKHLGVVAGGKSN